MIRLNRIADWPNVPEGYELTLVSGVEGDSRGRIYVLHRGPRPVLIFDESGRFVGTLGESEMETSVYFSPARTPPVSLGRRQWVHGLHVDPWDNVWITDVGRHLVYKFSPAGELVMTLGCADTSGESESLFNRPTGVLVIPSGEVYVADGYGNARVVKFSAEGKFLRAWGKRGNAPGEFHTPHALAYDPRGRIYVSDRENDRIQVFSLDGELLTVWPGLHSVNAMARSADDSLYLVGGLDNRLIRASREGEVLQTWDLEAPAGNPHSVWDDGKGYLYIGNVDGRCVTKYRIQAE